MSSIKVVVVDDHPLMRAGVAQTLQESGRFDVVAQGGSADDALRLSLEFAPEVILVDLSMPGGGIHAVARIVEAAPDVNVVVLTASEADEDIMAALRAGARGYVLKGVSAATLVEIVEGAAKGESYVAPALAARLLTTLRSGGDRGDTDPLSTLTQREEEILRLVASGLSNKEVGLRLDLQEKTVKHHMTRVLSKLNVRNRTEAAVLLRDSLRK